MHTPQKPILELADYPHEIAKVRAAIARLDNQITSWKEELESIETEIDACVAFDPELKNDNQRRAKRSQLKRDHSDYVVLESKLRDAEQSRLRLEIKLTLIRDLFSVAKLQKRQEIATLLVADIEGLGVVA